MVDRIGGPLSGLLVRRAMATDGLHTGKLLKGARRDATSNQVERIASRGGRASGDFNVARGVEHASAGVEGDGAGVWAEQPARARFRQGRRSVCRRRRKWWQSIDSRRVPTGARGRSVHGGFTARISKISPGGTRTTVVEGLPSSQTSPALGSLVSGVADVAFVHGRLEALISGAGCSHGLKGTSNEIIRVRDNGSTRQVANLSAFLGGKPGRQPGPRRFRAGRHLVQHGPLRPRPLRP